MDSEVRRYYELGGEADRLAAGNGRLERERTLELLHRYLPTPPATILDVGGAAGVYALPLAATGYRVHLIDRVPLHVQQAQAASAAARAPLTSIREGDARALPFTDGAFDAVLVLGPLYHLPDRVDRVTALAEARRVLRPGVSASPRGSAERPR